MGNKRNTRKKSNKSRRTKGRDFSDRSSNNSRNRSNDSFTGNKPVLVFGLNSVMEIAKAKPDTILEIHICRNDIKDVMGQINYHFETRPKMISYDQDSKDEFLSVLNTHGVNTEGENHQGIFCIREPYRVHAEEDFFKDVDEGELSDNKNFKVLVLDGIQDPHHFGALIRISAAFNIPWIIIQSTRSAPLTQVSVKVASGGAEHVKIAEVTNLSRFMEEVKSRDFWNIGTSERGENSWSKVREPGRYLLVIGNEGDGIRPGVQNQCDFWVRLPVNEDFPSLSASTAAAAALALLEH
jgi:23S rRNA (guanosine2251-2'-O)-methyltransferase